MVAKLINFVPKLKLFVGTTSETESGAEVACASSFIFTGSLHWSVHTTVMQKLHQQSLVREGRSISSWELQLERMLMDWYPPGSMFWRLWCSKDQVQINIFGAWYHLDTVKQPRIYQYHTAQETLTSYWFSKISSCIWLGTCWIPRTVCTWNI